MNWSEDLKAYLDGELEPMRAAEVRLALERDPALQRELEDLQILSQAVREVMPQIHTHGLDQTLQALDRQQRFRTFPRLVWVGACGLVAAAAIAFFVVLPSMQSQADSIAAGSLIASRASARAKGAENGAVLSAPSPTMARKMVHPAFPLPEHRVRRVALQDHLAPSRVWKATDGVAGGTVRARAPSINPRSTAGAMAKSPSPLRAAMATAAPTVVTLTFPTTEIGRQRVLAAAGAYLPSQSAADLGLPGSNSKVTIVLDIPDDRADKMIADLRRLQPAPASRQEAAPSGGFGGGSLYRRATALHNKSVVVTAAKKPGTAGKSADRVIAASAGESGNYSLKRNIISNNSGATTTVSSTATSNSRIVDSNARAVQSDANVSTNSSNRSSLQGNVINQSNRLGVGNAATSNVKMRRVIVVIQEAPRP